MRICPAHLEYAQYLDRHHGRAIAKNYLRSVTDPNYMSTQRLGAVKHAEKCLERSLFTPNPKCPPEGWEIATRKHIQEVGGEIVAFNPNISPQELEKRITKTYPFGAKVNHGYKVWRKELKSYISQIKFEQVNHWLGESYKPNRREKA